MVFYKNYSFIPYRQSHDSQSRTSHPGPIVHEHSLGHAQNRQETKPGASKPSCYGDPSPANAQDVNAQECSWKSYQSSQCHRHVKVLGYVTQILGKCIKSYTSNRPKSES